MSADGRQPPADSSGGGTGPIQEAKEWAQAVWFGLGDTVRDMLEAGRDAARSSTDRQWARFDSKTRKRRGKRS